MLQIYRLKFLHWSQRELENHSLCCLLQVKNVYSVHWLWLLLLLCFVQIENDINKWTKNGCSLTNDHECLSSTTPSRQSIRYYRSRCVMVNEHMSQIKYHFDVYAIRTWFCECSSRIGIGHSTRWRGGSVECAHRALPDCYSMHSNGWDMYTMIIMRSFMRRYSYFQVVASFTIVFGSACVLFYILCFLLSLHSVLISLIRCALCVFPPRFVRRIGFNLSFLDVCNLH